MDGHEEEAAIAPAREENGGLSPKNDEEEKTQETKQMVSVSELFSFTRTTKSRLCIAGGFFFAFCTGASFPGKMFCKAKCVEVLTVPLFSLGVLFLKSV